MNFLKKRTTRRKNNFVFLYALITIIYFVFTSTPATSATSNLPEWSYDDEAKTGPSYWATLTTDGINYPYETCGKGQEQSPIDLANATLKNTGDLDMRYKSWSLNIENNGHTIQINMAPGSTMEINRNMDSINAIDVINTMQIQGETYYLLQFHFHADSEHTVNGVHNPVEIHFVHMNSRGELAVLGVFIEEDPKDNPNAEIATILELAPHEVGKNTVTDNAIKAAKLLPSKNIDNFWYYDGSLTTPPCTEGVKWYVAEQHIHASHDQIADLKELLQHHGIPNYRPSQPLNDRTLYESIK